MALLPEQNNEGAGRSLADSSLFGDEWRVEIFLKIPLAFLDRACYILVL
jgi:hypothetical protein